MMRLIYGFDPLCGWCFGMVPAMRAVQAALPDLPIHLALPGLVTGDRVGPYALMEGYIRGASQRLQAVTGRAPADAFFATITRPGVIGQSAPPALLLAAARAVDPLRVVNLAHRVIEAHFQEGADLNDPATYPPLLAASGISMTMPDIHGDAGPLWQSEAHWGIRSFPTLMLDGPQGRQTLPTAYDPDQVMAFVRSGLSAPNR
jgi:putative protein-disulfide isomerase